MSAENVLRMIGPEQFDSTKQSDNNICHLKIISNWYEVWYELDEWSVYDISIKINVVWNNHNMNDRVWSKFIYEIVNNIFIL